MWTELTLSFDSVRFKDCNSSSRVFTPRIPTWEAAGGRAALPFKHARTHPFKHVTRQAGWLAGWLASKYLAVWCVRSDCGCVSGLVVLTNDTLRTQFHRGRDGNSEEMALKRIALPLLALCGLVAVGNGKFQLSTSPAFVSMCFPGLGIACCRSSSWRSVSGIWLTASS